MISTVERLSPAKVQIHIEVDSEAFEGAVQKAYMKQRTRINMPGFRRGKAPRKLVESIYGPKAFYNEAIDDLFPEAYGRAVVENKLNPIDQPQIDVQQAEPGQPLLMTVTATVYPDVTVGDLSDIDVERPGDEVDDDAVEQEIQRVREANARITEIEDRPAQDDDLVRIDYRGTIGGEPFEGGEAENEELTIGSGSFVAGFEDQIVGMNVGDERDIDITFPADYFQDDLQGKAAVFHIKMRSIHTRELPELDDEFAKDVSEFDTLDEYRADTRKRLEEQAKVEADNEYEAELLGALTDRTVTEAPDIMIEREAYRGLERQASRLVGNNPERIESIVKVFANEESVMKYHREEAQKRVLMFLATEELIKREHFEYDADSEADKDVYAETLADALKDEGTDEETFLKSLDENIRKKESFHNIVARRKAFKYLQGIAEANAAKGEKRETEAKTASAE